MPAVQCFRRLCSRGGKIAPADLDRLDAIGPRPPPSGEASIVVLFDVTEIQMAQYLLDHSAAEPGRRSRILRSLKVLLIIPLVACFNYWPFVIPFADPAGGMWANWTYLIAHIFALNYIAGRCMLAVWTRAFRHEDLAEVWCVMWSAPLVTPCVCGLIHVVASFAGVFPVPLSAAAACLPAVLVTQRVAQYFMPAHVVTATVRQFGWFLFVVIGAWSVEIVLLLVWWKAYPHMTSAAQVFTTLLMAAGVAGVSWSVKMAADRCFDLPRHLTMEVRGQLIFLSLLCSASVLPQAKSIEAVLAIVILDAAKALGVAAVSLVELVALLREPKFAEGASAAETRSCCGNVQQHARHKYEEFRVGLQKLRFLARSAKQMSAQQLREMRVSAQDAAGYGEFGRCLMHLAMLELCEVLVPVVYLIMALLLRSDWCGKNRNYFWMFAGQTDEDFLDGMWGNLYALAVEIAVFLGLEATVRALTGFSLWEFAAITIGMDFSYWLFSLSPSYIMWNVIQVEHGGFHPLMRWVESFFT